MSSRPMSSLLCSRLPGLVLSSISSDLVFPFRPNNHVHVEGILHSSDSTGEEYNRHYWINPVDLWPCEIHHLCAEGFDIFTYTEFSSPDKWREHHPDKPLRHDSLTTVSFPDEPPHVSQHSMSMPGQSDPMGISTTPPGAPTPHAPLATSPTTLPLDTTIYYIIRQNNLMMQHQSATLTAAIQALMAQQAAAMNQAIKTRPAINFPQWDGDPLTF